MGVPQSHPKSHDFSMETTELFWGSPGLKKPHISSFRNRKWPAAQDEVRDYTVDILGSAHVMQKTQA